MSYKCLVASKVLFILVKINDHKHFDYKLIQIEKILDVESLLLLFISLNIDKYKYRTK